ncbi:MAG: NUDIX hydrolase [Cellvibrionaceae bacterium]|nr:NUDIX hydrolase [Cellvibrionaceae bacterium]
MWHPHVTVATVVEKQGRFLVVKEECLDETVYNQPAGHLDPNESLIDAAIRETREETAWEVKINYLIGVQHYHSTANQITYIRFSFNASPLKFHSEQALDTGIICAEWKTLAELEALELQLRSPMVLGDIKQYLQGKRYPLELLNTVDR